MRAALIAVLFAAACGRSDAARLRGIADEMCACTDAGCIAQARGELADLEREVAARGDVPDELVKASAEVGTCETKAWAAIGAGDPDLARLAKARDQVCACTDTACLGRAQGELDALAAALDARFPAKDRPTPPMMAIGADVGRCIAAAVAGPASGTPR